MKTGYYYKLNDKWHCLLINIYSVSIEELIPIEQIDKLFYHDRVAKTWLCSNTKRYSESKDLLFFKKWRQEAPAHEELILLEIMFP